MKKWIFVFLVLCISAQAFAYNYDASFKKGFYDEFIASFFQGMQQSLISQGFNREKTYTFISTLRARLNREQLEKETWGCVSGYTVEQMKTGEFTEKCFGKWSQRFMFQENMDAILLLK